VARACVDRAPPTSPTEVRSDRAPRRLHRRTDDDVAGFVTKFRA